MVLESDKLTACPLAPTNQTASVYVHQLQATNGMVHAYQTKTLPRLLEVSGSAGVQPAD